MKKSLAFWISRHFFHKGKLFGSKSNKKPIYKAAELKPPSNEVISTTVEAEKEKE